MPRTHPTLRSGLAALLPFVLLLLLAACDDAEPIVFDMHVGIPGVTDNEIRIGSSLALSGHASFLGEQTLQGALAYINHINETGGVHSRRIKLIARDDRYDPPLCMANTQRFLQDGDVFALFCYVGTPTTVKILPMVKRARIPLIGMFTGANALRQPFNRYLINVRASYYQETGAAVRHLVEDLGVKDIAVFYQYDAYGLDGLRGAELALQRYNLAPVEKSSYIRGTLDVEEGLETILEADPQAVIMIGTYEPCAKFIHLAKDMGADMLFYNVSFVGGEQLAKLLGDEGDGVIVSQVFPPPNLPEVRDMLDSVDQYVTLSQRYFPDGEISSVGLEGFYNAMVLVEGLRRAGPDLTRERLIDALETMTNLPLGPDNFLTFSPTDHQGMDTVYFTRMENGKLSLITDWMNISLDGDIHAN